jgi:hypothetical protein
LLVVPTIRPPLAQSLLALSSIILLLTMLLASGYGIGRHTGAFSLTIPRMVQLHGWGNALFVLSGVVGWLVGSTRRLFRNCRPERPTHPAHSRAMVRQVRKLPECTGMRGVCCRCR